MLSAYTFSAHSDNVLSFKLWFNDAYKIIMIASNSVISVKLLIVWSSSVFKWDSSIWE